MDTDCASVLVHGKDATALIEKFLEKSLYKYKIEKSNIKNLINFSKCKHLSICDDEILIKCTGLQMSFKERFKSNDWILKKPLSYKYFVSTMNFEIKY